MNLSEKLAAIDATPSAPGDGAPVADVITGPREPAKPPATRRQTAPVPTVASRLAARPANAGARGRQNTDAWEATKRKVRELVLEDLVPRMQGLSPEALHNEVKAALDRILQREDVVVSPVERRKFIREVIADTLGYGPLDPLLRDDAVSEIMCNAFDDIWVERHGRIEETDFAFSDDDQYRKVIQKIVAAVGRRVDESSPMVDARLPDGSRVNAIVPPLALHGAVLTIRKFAADPLTATDLVDAGTYTPDLVTVLDAAVRGRLNILVSGGTGTGKTTNLNVLSSFIPAGERIITIEDSAELQLQQRHTINLESRPPNAEGIGEVTIRELVRNALRMRPDRIIVGECRSGEALDMLQAMNSGHEGSMTTIHAPSPRDALVRLETMVLMAGFDLPMRAIREQVAAAIDLIIQVDRLPSGQRVVSSVTEVQGLEGEVVVLQDVFHLVYDGAEVDGRPTGRLVSTGLRPRFLERLAEQGVALAPTTFRTAAPPPVVPAPTDPPRAPKAATRVLRRESDRSGSTSEVRAHGPKDPGRT